MLHALSPERGIRSGAQSEVSWGEGKFKGFLPISYMHNYTIKPFVW
jgi:hypothetical protein